MKISKFNGILLYLIVYLSLGLSVGDHLELKNYLNARTDARFTKDSNNIEKILPKGTVGEVLDIKPMPSGNFGIKIKIESGENYWVYYNKKTPAMDLIDSKNTKIEKMTNQKQINSVKNVKLLKPQLAFLDSENKFVLDSTKEAVKNLEKKSIAQLVPAIKSTDCIPSKMPESNVPEAKYKETDTVMPYREISNSSLHSKSCQTSESGWDFCKSTESGLIEGIKLINNGPNSIVKTNEYYIRRELGFEFDDHARSDIKLLIVDSPDDTTSHATYSVMLFFPRSVLPSIKKIGDVLEVTLPNKEKVQFNAKTKEIIGGVFKEGPMAQSENKKAKPAAIIYTGEGVVIRADKSGDLPYGDIEKKDGKSAPSISTATISKKGFKDCKIPSKDIWYTDEKKGGNTFIMPSLASDQGMDEFINKKCGFSLF
jgi:hypothetical protein